MSVSNAETSDTPQPDWSMRAISAWNLAPRTPRTTTQTENLFDDEETTK